MLSGCLENTIKVYGTDMELNQMEQEAIVVEQLEWLLKYEMEHEVQDQDWELMSALVRVLKEFKVNV
jgi:hypothetical protein